MTQSIDSLTAEIGTVVTGILQTDVALLRGYSQAKARSIASFTLIQGRAYAAGTLDKAQMEEEAAELERMVVRFVRNIQALVATTIERLLSGIGQLLLSVLRQLTGLPSLTLGPTAGEIWGVRPA